MRMRALLAGAFLAGALIPISASAPSACAAEGFHAALVIDAGAAGVSRMCVTLPDDSVTGIELVQLASDQHGLDYRLGYSGEAVCMLAGVGPQQGDCFGDYPSFWAYWHGSPQGGWSWASAGAASGMVEDGDVEGWSWGKGDDPETHPPPPVTFFDAVCKPVASSPSPSAAASSPPSAGEKSVEAPPTPARGSDDDEPSSAPTAGPSHPTPSPAHTPRPPGERPIRAHDHNRAPRMKGPAMAVGTDGRGFSGGGPPAAGVAGLAGAAALSSVAWLSRRRRTRGS
jgi:hypothetical protein